MLRLKCIVLSGTSLPEMIKAREAWIKNWKSAMAVIQKYNIPESFTINELNKMVIYK